MANKIILRHFRMTCCVRYFYMWYCGKSLCYAPPNRMIDEAEERRPYMDYEDSDEWGPWYDILDHIKIYGEEREWMK